MSGVGVALKKGEEGISDCSRRERSRRRKFVESKVELDKIL